MRYLLCLISLAVLFISCRKSSKEQLTTGSSTSYTYAQIWDSLDIQYEHKYWLDPLEAAYKYDTIIFHADSTVTEIHSALRSCANCAVTYKVDPEYFYNCQIFSVQEKFCALYAPLIDTLNGFIVHDNLLADPIVATPLMLTPNNGTYITLHY